MDIIDFSVVVFLSWCLDYRLNPVLRKACKADIPKFCQSVLNKATDDGELEGQVISCLKLKYADQVLNRNLAFCCVCSSNTFFSNSDSVESFFFFLKNCCV